MEVPPYVSLSRKVLHVFKQIGPLFSPGGVGSSLLAELALVREVV